MTTSTEQLAHQFAKLNEDFSSFWATRKADGSFDMLHPASGTTFQNQCAELVQEALQAAATPSETFKMIEVHNSSIPGASEGFAAAYGMSCACDLQNMKLLWKGISDIASSLGVSLVTQSFRRGFWAVRNHGGLSINESQWGDATLGCLLLNGPKYLNYYKPFDLGNNVPGIYQYFQLLKNDPGCQQDWNNAGEACLSLIERDILPLSYEPARDVRRMVLGDKLVSGAECSTITADLPGCMANDSFTLNEFSDRLAILAYHASYLKNGFSADFIYAISKAPDADGDGDDDLQVNDDGDFVTTELFKAKLSLLYQTLCEHHPAPDVLMAAWACRTRIGDCYDVRDLYHDDPLWVQKNLLLRIESSQKKDAYDNRPLRLEVFLQALLEPLTADEVLEICGHSDEARALGFKVNADTRLLKNVQDEKVLTSALEYSLGI
jgi:hypothetical protein